MTINANSGSSSSSMSTMMLLIVLLLAVTAPIHTSAQVCDAKTGTCDKHQRCETWKEQGECYRSRSYMQEECPVSCQDTQRPKQGDGDCQDVHEDCTAWAKEGECESNRADLSIFCPEACGECDDDDDNDCTNGHELCEFWAEQGECTKNPNYMLSNCAKSCDNCPKKPKENDNEPNSSSSSSSSSSSESDEPILDRSTSYGERQIATGNERQRVLDRVESTLQYMKSPEVLDLPDKIQQECKNRHELCTFWQVIGECEANKSYMQTQCAAACHTCQLIDHDRRCPKLKDAKPALEPGGLHEMFDRILKAAPGNRTTDNPLTEQEQQELESTGTPHYTVHVHSQPSDDNGPWVVTFENFLTDEECDELVQLGYKYEYKRSEDVGKRKFDGTFDSVKSSGRTSENAWCSEREGCRNETVAQRVHERMARVMDIPPENSEDLQLLKYEVGQFYNAHHDYIPHQRDRQCGPRILTFFLYLSDVEAGGGTNFPRLDLTVMPKKGRALLWPSVLNDSPMNQDGRTRHQALPVEAGTKFAANGWIHMYDYMTPQQTGCN